MCMSAQSHRAVVKYLINYLRCRKKGSFIRFSSSCYTLVRFDVTVEVIVILYIQDEKNQKLKVGSSPSLNIIMVISSVLWYLDQTFPNSMVEQAANVSLMRCCQSTGTPFSKIWRSSCSKVSCSEQAPPCWTAKCVCACVCLRVCVWVSQGRSWSKQSVITPAESEEWKTWSGVMDQTERVT